MQETVVTTCQNCMILHCTACWWKLNSLLHVYCLLVETAFLIVHAGDGCDNLSKLHDFTLHRLLVKAKFLTARALLAGGSRISDCTCRRRLQQPVKTA